MGDRLIVRILIFLGGFGQSFFPKCLKMSFSGPGMLIYQVKKPYSGRFLAQTMNIVDRELRPFGASRSL
jgi:hypothetical protein